MMTRLSISNYALIDRLDMEPSRSLSIVTGETGAGKSIMLGALSLLLGERADTKAIALKDRKSTVEAVFTDVDRSDLTLDELISQADPEWDGRELILRRELLPSGRTRAFVNDSPVKLNELGAISHRLFDIHSQHSNSLLIDADSQLHLIDLLAQDSEILSDYRQEFRRYVTLRNRIKRLQEENEKIKANRAVYQFQLEQLDRLDPKPGEQEQVERRYDILSESEDLREHLSSAYRNLAIGEDSILEKTADTIQHLRTIDMSLFESMNGHSAELPEDQTIEQRLEQAYIELKDISETLRVFAQEVEADPNELARVTKRMNELYEAARQFKTEEPDGLVKLRENLRKSLREIDGGGQDMQELEAETRACAHALKEKAELLSATRAEAAERFSTLLEETARPLGLPSVRFKVELTRGKLTKDGADNIRFLCSFNKNMELQDIAKVASGGELSRVMLSIKAIVADETRQPTVIFDEIDTGVSGEIADRMGDMMRRMSSGMQIITITHLPQVAAKGDIHFKVFKADTEDRTVSNLRQLSRREREEEIAAMISGKTINESALKTARALLRT